MFLASRRALFCLLEGIGSDSAVRSSVTLVDGKDFFDKLRTRFSARPVLIRIFKITLFNYISGSPAPHRSR